MEHANQHVGWILWKRHQSSHIGNINSMDSRGARLAGQQFYSMVHIFFMTSQDLIDSMPHSQSTDCLEVVCFVSAVCRCVAFTEETGYSLHFSYFLVSL